MERKYILEKKLLSQELRNRIKQFSGLKVIEIVDFEHVLVQRYLDAFMETMRYSWPVHDSTEYSKVFDDNLVWLKKILSFQKDGDKWLLTITRNAMWWIYIEILDYRQAMRELWWERDGDITAVDLSNQLVFDIGRNEELIEVRLNYLENNLLNKNVI